MGNPYWHQPWAERATQLELMAEIDLKQESEILLCLFSPELRSHPQNTDKILKDNVSPNLFKFTFTVYPA